MIATFLCLAAVAIDGDTLRCANVEQANGRVRLARIDAAELHEPGGAEAQAALAALLTGPVQCRRIDADPRRAGFQGEDRYGRIVARCRVNRRDLGETLIASGHAVVWPRRKGRK